MPISKPSSHNPFSMKNKFRLLVLTAITGVIYILLKIQGKLRL